MSSAWENTIMLTCPFTVLPITSHFYNSPAEIQGDLAIASIENVFVYSDRYGHSDLKSD